MLRVLLAIAVVAAAGCGTGTEPEYETGADARRVADEFARNLPARTEDRVGRVTVRRLRATRRALQLKLVGEPTTRRSCALPGESHDTAPCFEYYLVGRPRPTVLHERMLRVWVAREDGALDVFAIAARGTTTRCDRGFRPDADPPPETRRTLTSRHEVECTKPGS